MRTWLCASMSSTDGARVRTRGATSVLAALLLLGACGGDDDADARVTFTSPVYGYSIARPRSWDSVNARRTLTDSEQPATSSGATDILGTDASMRVSAMTLPGVIIAAQPVRNDVTIEEWTSSMVDTVAFMKRCDRPDRRERVEIGGEPGILLTYRDCPPNLGLLHLWAGVVHEGLGYHIVWFNDRGHEDADRAEFERMLASMSFDQGGSRP